jgi:hypothetical protein
LKFDPLLFIFLKDFSFLDPFFIYNYNFLS